MFVRGTLCGTISRPNWRDDESLRPCQLGNPLTAHCRVGPVPQSVCRSSFP